MADLSIWPALLPQIPLLPQGSQAPFQAPIETEMEVGPPRAGGAATATWTAVTFAYCMTAAQFAIYEVFVRDTLKHGSARFMIPAWRPGAYAPLPQKIARIAGGQPSWKPTGSHVIVTLPLSILDY